MEFISNYDFEIMYQPDKGNEVAKALSQRHSVLATLMFWQLKEWKHLETLVEVGV